MTISDTLYPLIEASTSATIYPTTAPTNPDVPHAVYTVSSSERIQTTTGVCGLTRYGITVDVSAANWLEAESIADQIGSALNGYRGGMIRGSTLANRVSMTEQPGYHVQLLFSVWFDGPEIEVQPQSTGIVRTGNGFVELEACGVILRVDCNGISFIGDTTTYPPE